MTLNNYCNCHQPGTEKKYLFTKLVHIQKVERMTLKTTACDSRLHKDEETGKRVQKAWGNPIAAFQYLREGDWEDRTRLCRGVWQEDKRQWSSAEGEEILTGDKGKHFNPKDSQQWNKLSRKLFAASPSLEIFNQLDKVQSNLVWIQCWPCFG